MTLPTNDEARLAYFETFASTDLFLVLKDEATGASLHPRMFETSQGTFALAYFDEEALADGFGETEYAALPGRVLARLLLEQNVGLLVDMGAPAEALLDPAALKWLVDVLAAPPAPLATLASDISPPDVEASKIAGALLRRLPEMAGLADVCVLVRSGQVSVIGVIGAAAPTHGVIAQTLNEVLIFADAGPGWHIGFVEAGSDHAVEMTKVGTVLPIPKPQKPERPAQVAPGADKSKPPRLR